MEIKTGYFGQMRKYIEMGYTPTSIVLFPPKWYNGKNLKVYAPSLELFNNYRTGRIADERFKLEYELEVEDTGLEPLKQYIKEKEQEGVSKIVLLCFEKPNETCHRHILAKYINENTNFSVEEIKLQ